MVDLKTIGVVAINVTLSILALELAGALHFYSETGGIVYFKSPEISKTQPVHIQGYKQRLHPYFGFVGPYSVQNPDFESAQWYTNNLGFPQLQTVRVPFVPKRDDFVVMVFGGSVAANVVTAPQGGIPLKDALQKLDVLKSRNVIVYNMAQGSGKQPQQLIELSFLLALGQHIDLVINVDGFNEFALGYGNSQFGVHPVMPAIQVIGALGLELGHPSERSLQFLEAAYRMTHARSAVKEYSALLPLSGSGIIWIKNRAALTVYESRLAAHLRKYDSAIKPINQSESWQRAKETLSLDMQTEAAGDATFELLFDIWVRSAIQMQRSAAANEIGYVHIIQPYLYRAKPNLTAAEMKIAGSLPADHTYRIGAGRGYELMEQRSDQLRSHGIVSAVNLFQELSDTMYVDPFHYSKTGETLFNEFIAVQVSHWAAAIKFRN